MTVRRYPNSLHLRVKARLAHPKSVIWPAMLSSFAFFSFATVIAATSVARSNCVGTISSLDDVSNAVACTTVNINAFTVPAGKTLELNLLDGTTVNVCERNQILLICEVA